MVLLAIEAPANRQLIRSGDWRAIFYVRKPVDFQSFVEGARQSPLCWPVLHQPPPLRA